MDVPSVIHGLADELATSDGVVAVVVGGSRALGEHRPDSDWDLGLYYRGDVALSALSARGDVHPPGSWGRIMNGGAWLTIDDLRVDVLLRDLDAVEAWAALARQGRFEIDGLLGYVAGIPTYSLLAEVSIAVPLRGRARSRRDVPAGAPAARAGALAVRPRLQPVPRSSPRRARQHGGHGRAGRSSRAGGGARPVL